jgi:HK97 family phage major capsid protein
MAEIEQRIDEIKGLVETLRKQADKAEEGKVSKADLEEMKSNMQSDFEASKKELQDRLDAAEAKMNRPGVDSLTGDERKDAQSKAFETYMRKGRESLEPAEVKLLSSDNDTTGGYVVTGQMGTDIIKNVRNLSPIRQYCDSITLTTAAYYEYPKQTGTASTAKRGERGAVGTTTNPTLGMGKIPVHIMYAMPYTTQVLLDDTGFGVESWLASEVAESFASEEGDWFLNGNGVDEAEGILTNATILASYTPSGAATALDDFDAIRKLKYSLHSKYRANARWIMNSNTELAVSLLKDGEGRYLWAASTTEGSPTMLDGKAIINDETMPDVGAGAYPVLFGDYRRGYKIVDKSQIHVIRDNITDKGFVKFYTERRVGGGVVLAEAIKPLKIAAS